MQKSRKLSLWQLEMIRYSKKGASNIAIAIMLLVFAFTAVYKVGTLLWPEHIENKPMFYIKTSISIHTILVVANLLFYLPAYLSSNSYLQRFRINNVQNLRFSFYIIGFLLVLGQQMALGPDKTIKNLLMSHIIFYPLGIFIASVKPANFAFPSFQQFVTQVLVCLYVEDIGFFLTHRLFHTPFFYKHFHKQHHEYDNPFSSVSEYCHPVEYFLGNMVPSAVALSVFGSNIYAFSGLAFIFFRLNNTNEVHSGIEFPFSPMRILPMASSSSFHNFHHSKNSGVYGSFTYIWDYLTGNYYDYSDYYFAKEIDQQLNLQKIKA